jgi:hypothetical protein
VGWKENFILKKARGREAGEQRSRGAEEKMFPTDN